MFIGMSHTRFVSYLLSRFNKQADTENVFINGYQTSIIILNKMYTFDRDSGTVVGAVDVDACVVDVGGGVDDAAAETDESIPGGLFRISQ